MPVKRSKRFNGELLEIIKFIAKNNPKNARRFYNQILAHVQTLTDNPKKGRPAENGSRELIYKGYVIPYFIDGESILILGIFSQNEWKQDS